MHQQLHVIRNTAHRPSTQASYTASRVRPKRKISSAAAQIAATLTISFPRWRHMSLTSYWGQQRMSLTSYPGQPWIWADISCADISSSMCGAGSLCILMNCWCTRGWLSCTVHRRHRFLVPTDPTFYETSVSMLGLDKPGRNHCRYWDLKAMYFDQGVRTCGGIQCSHDTDNHEWCLMWYNVKLIISS